jgi:hypothetical protein
MMWVAASGEISDLCQIDADRLGNAQAQTRPALDLQACRAGAKRQPRPRPASAELALVPAAGFRPTRQSRSQFRRLCLDVRAQHPDHRHGQGNLGPLPHPGDPLDFDCAFTNTVPVDAIRGAGEARALFLLDGWSTSPPRDRPHPADLRQLNLLKADEMPYAAAAATPTTRRTARACSRRR